MIPKLFLQCTVDPRQIIQDVDEFIVPKKLKTIPELLDTKDDPTNGKQFL